VFANERKDVFGLRVASEHRLREEQFAVEVNVEDASRSRNDLDSLNQLLPLLENARNQTGRVRQRSSGNAVLDPDTMLRSHRSIVVSAGLLSAERSSVAVVHGPAGTCVPMLAVLATCSPPATQPASIEGSEGDSLLRIQEVVRRHGLRLCVTGSSVISHDVVSLARRPVGMGVSLGS